MTNITYHALHNITPDDAQRLNTNLEVPWPVSGSQTLTHYGKTELTAIAQGVNIWQNTPRHILTGGIDDPNVDFSTIFKPIEEIEENDVWELKNHQPIQTPALTPKQLLITLSVPVSLFAGLVMLIAL